MSGERSEERAGFRSYDVATMPSHFLYGTSSWLEKSWLGPFYPPGAKPDAPLEAPQ
jgi:hypothetical protein